VWLRQRIADLETGQQSKAKDWGIAALVPHHLHVRWMACTNKKHALELEQECLNLLKDVGLWNHQA
jgi:hypothetical protein